MFFKNLKQFSIDNIDKPVFALDLSPQTERKRMCGVLLVLHDLSKDGNIEICCLFDSIPSPTADK